MLKDIIKSTKTDLPGNVFKSSNKIFTSFFFFSFFFVYCFITLYLLVIDTSFIAQFDIFFNKYFLATVCATAVIVGFVLLVFAYYCKFKKDVWFLSFHQNITAENILVSFALKILTVYTLTVIKKIFWLTLFLSPAGIFGAVVYNISKNGVAPQILAALIIAAVIIFISGGISASVFLNRYSLVSYYLAKDRNSSIKDIFSASIINMNSKCGKLFALKIYNFPKKIISLLLFPSPYYLSLCNLSEMQLILGKTNSLIRKKAQREKTVVYYFGNSIS